MGLVAPLKRIVQRFSCELLTTSKACDHLLDSWPTLIDDPSLGEEADIVLLSLVRNPGPEKMGAIGFLKVSRLRISGSFYSYSAPSH